MRANRLLELTLAAVLMSCAPGLVRAQCPENSSVIRGIPFSSTLPSKNWSFNECALHGCSGGSTSYSIPLGTLSCGASASAEFSTTASLTVADQFQVVGVPAGTQATITLRLFGWADGAQVLADDLAGHQIGAYKFAPDVNYDVSMPLTVTAGQLFPLTFTQSASAIGTMYNGFVTASFAFTGLPPGASVISCNGYTSGSAVPTRRSSWGVLKSHYR